MFKTQVQSLQQEVKQKANETQNLLIDIASCEEETRSWKSNVENVQEEIENAKICLFYLIFRLDELVKLVQLQQNMWVWSANEKPTMYWILLIRGC